MVDEARRDVVVVVAIVEVVLSEQLMVVEEVHFSEGVEEEFGHAVEDVAASAAALDANKRTKSLITINE